MKLLFFQIVFFLSTTFVVAQQLNKNSSDSIKALITETYALNYKSEYGKAIAKSNQILEFLETHPDSLLLGNLYRSLSFSYAELKNKEKSLEYIFKSIEIGIKTKDTFSIIGGYNDLGVTYKDFDIKDKAQEAFIETLRYAERYKTDYTSISPYFNLGDILVKYEGKYAEAEPYFLKSLEHAKKAELSKKELIFVDIYIALGLVNHKLKKHKQSEFYFNEGFKIATNEKYFTTLVTYYNTRIKLYEEDNNYAEAIASMEQLNIVRDSIDYRNEIELVKKIEAEFKIKKNEKKLNLIKKERTAKTLLYQRSRQYNIILILFSGVLLVAVYYAYVNNKKLKEAKQKADELTNLKSAFYSEISHELRTPLYAVIELSSLLLNENASQTHKEYLEPLKFSANHLMALVNNVLELNKIESGKLRVEILNINLENLFSNIIKSLEYALLQSKNTISLSYDKAIPEQLTGDALKLSQIMINLISNAIKFTRKGHINVTVKKIGDTQDGVKLYFEVSDNGVGISQKNQKKIFEAYFQDSYQSDQTIKGTGLGLSIVHRLLKVLGSQINIVSEINKGSTFYFELPFTCAKEEKGIHEDLETQKKAIKGLHILIVDDNLVNQLVTKKILETLDITFDVVNRGKKAILTVKNKKIDCILMDLHMPEMDGYTTSKHIREFNPKIPIIAFTAGSSLDIIERMKKSEMNAYILKPFLISDLVETIHEVTSKVSVQ